MTFLITFFTTLRSTPIGILIDTWNTGGGRTIFLGGGWTTFLGGGVGFGGRSIGFTGFSVGRIGGVAVLSGLSSLKWPSRISNTALEFDLSANLVLKPSNFPFSTFLALFLLFKKSVRLISSKVGCLMSSRESQITSLAFGEQLAGVPLQSLMKISMFVNLKKDPIALMKSCL